MCLIGFSWKNHPQYKLILIANRDEFYHRPTQALQAWEENPAIYAGKDLEGGGTWLGMNQKGEFSALTNYRDLKNLKESAPTRGFLTLDYLKEEHSPEAYLENIAPQAPDYNGFNLLVGNLEDLFYFSNYEGKIRNLSPGLYALSNHLLDSDWFKVNKLKEAMSDYLEGARKLEEDVLLSLIQDQEVPPDESVQQTGLSIEQERILAPMFIRSEKYGTHSSSVILIDYENRISFTEKVYPNSYRPESFQKEEWQVR